MSPRRGGGLARVTGCAAVVVLGTALVTLLAHGGGADAPTGRSSPRPTAAPSDAPSPSGGTSAAIPSREALVLSTSDLAGWRHQGPGRFVVEELDGEVVYRSEGGMGLLWYEQPFGDFTLTFEVQVADALDNSGVFLRIPEPPVDDGYVNAAFEVQIDTDGEGSAGTGAIYSVQGPFAPVRLEPGVWHRFEIVADGPAIDVSVDGALVNAFQARTEGVVERFAGRGFLGLQNHGNEDSVRYRRIRVTPH